MTLNLPETLDLLKIVQSRTWLPQRISTMTTGHILLTPELHSLHILLHPVRVYVELFPSLSSFSHSPHLFFYHSCGFASHAQRSFNDGTACCLLEDQWTTKPFQLTRRRSSVLVVSTGRHKPAPCPVPEAARRVYRRGKVGHSMSVRRGPLMLRSSLRVCCLSHFQDTMSHSFFCLAQQTECLNEMQAR